MEKKTARLQGKFTHLVGAPGGDALEKVVRLVECGQIEPVIDRTFTFEEGAEAIKYHKSGRAAGKVVVVVHDNEQNGGRGEGADGGSAAVACA